MSKANLIRRLVAVFLAVTIVMSISFYALYQLNLKNVKNRYEAIASSHAVKIEDYVDRILARAYTLRALVVENEGDLSFFDIMAPTISNEINSKCGMKPTMLALAPEGTIRRVYPLYGNEKEIGFTIIDKERHRNSPELDAYYRGKLLLSEPFTRSRDGSIRIVARLPVHTNLVNGTKTFWGLVVMTMDFTQMRETMNLAGLTDMGYRYSLWYTNYYGKVVTLAGEENLEDAVNYEFAVENLTWNLSLLPINGWISSTAIALIALFILLFALLITFSYYSRLKLKAANRELLHLAHIDGLTHCYSRNYVNTMLINPQSGAWLQPMLSKYSLAIIDVDYFKGINDSFGHEAGDQALIRIAQALMGCVQEVTGDCVIRFGGDEFVVLINNVTNFRLQRKLNTIVNSIRDLHLSAYPDMRLSVSIGAVHYGEDGCTLYYDLMKKADEKLYTSKKNGRNQFTL